MLPRQIDRSLHDEIRADCNWVRLRRSGCREDPHGHRDISGEGWWALSALYRTVSHYAVRSRFLLESPKRKTYAPNFAFGVRRMGSAGSRRKVTSVREEIYGLGEGAAPSAICKKQVNFNSTDPAMAMSASTESRTCSSLLV